jgi:hypothetical protein
MIAIFDFLACATCRPDPNSNLAGAANGAVFVMLVFMGVVFSGLAAMIFRIVRRARAFRAVIPDNH